MADKTNKKTSVKESTRNTELTLEQASVEGLSQSQIVWRRFWRHKGAVISLIVLASIVLVAFTSVGTVVGGTGKLSVVNGVIQPDGWRIPGWWPYDWYTNYPIYNPGGSPTWE